MGLPKLIAICGAKRSGKDTIAMHLVSKHGYERLALADPIKSVVGLLFGFTDAQMETDDKETIDERWGVSPRAALQFFGTEVMQYKIQELLPGIGRLFWTRCLVNKIDPGKTYVISDVRFHHECDALREAGAFVIKLDRPSVQSSDAHASEVEQRDIAGDAYITNDGGIEGLLSKVDAMLVELDNPLATK